MKSGTGLTRTRAGRTAGPMDDLLAFACRLADAARAQTLPRWRDTGAANKATSGYDPVTDADIAAEDAMRALIAAEYPDHGITGEERGEMPGTGPWSWSLDPIDGTRAFVCGLPSWTTLIALLREGAPVLGIIDVPRVGERYIGSPAGSRLIDGAGDTRLRTSGCTTLAEARLATTDPYLFAGGEAEAFARVRGSVRLTRYGLDAYAYARLAAGSIDLVVETGLKPHDLNALLPVVRGAGGMAGDWTGSEDVSAGRLLAAATPELFAETVALLDA